MHGPETVIVPLLDEIGALPIQGDLQVAGVAWKGRRWKFEGRRRACRVAGGVYLTHRGGGTP